jgi:DNA-binding beta-propeller fold protein YncE
MNAPRHLVTALLALAGTILASPLSAASADYRIVARFPIGGDGGYDYLRVDSAARRLYVAHQKVVNVLDADTGKVIGEIGGLNRAHGIAISPETGHGFVTSGIDDQVTMFDTKSLAVIKRVKATGSNPDAIEYDAGTRRIYIACHGSGDLMVIDPASGDTVGTVKFGEGKLEGIGFDGRGNGFVNAEDKSAVFVFDVKTLQPKAKWSSAPGEGGTGLAVDAAHHRVFSACANNKVVVLDSDSGKVVATPAIGGDPDGIAFEASTGRIFSPNNDGTMTVIQENSPDNYSVLQTISTPAGCRTIALDEKTGRVATCAPKYGPTPAQVKGGPRPRPPVLPGTFEAIVIGTK